jgi:hypothetical protein
MKNILKEIGLGSTENVFKPTLFAKNLKERLEFVKMQKDWTICGWKMVVFSGEIRINHLCSNEIYW